jgi:hypothetical protein
VTAAAAAIAGSLRMLPIGVRLEGLRLFGGRALTDVTARRI